jgi:hypothetical protein
VSKHHVEKQRRLARNVRVEHTNIRTYQRLISLQDACSNYRRRAEKLSDCDMHRQKDLHVNDLLTGAYTYVKAGTLRD